MKNDSSIWRKDVVGWSLYDFANTIYSMNIVSLYLKRYIVEDLGKDDRYFDIPFSISMLIAAALLPALGAISDHSTKKKIFLFLFTLTCCGAVGLMAAVPATSILALLVLFIVANFAYEAGQPFYNALLYSVADGRQARFVSGFGVSLGYVGSVVGMLIVLPFVTGSMFGLEVPLLEGGGKVASFLPTAVLFLLFALPLFVWVRERPVVKPTRVNLGGAYRDVWRGLTETRKYPGVLRFLIADYFLEDAVFTVILNIGIYCSIVIGFAEVEITRFLIVSTVSAVVGSYVIGRVAQVWSLKKIMMLIIAGWVVTLVAFVLTTSTAVIWILGSVIGILMGGLWTVSRPMLAELVPREELGRFFGLFSLSGRAAAVIGPLIWTTAVYWFQPGRYPGQLAAEFLNLSPDSMVKLPYKVGVLFLGVMMLIGLFLFRKVPDPLENSHGR